jgi:hypothetical protein
MPSQKKMKAIRDQKARQSAFYKAKREANPASKDYKKPGAKKKDASKKDTAPPKKKDAKAKAKAPKSKVSRPKKPVPQAKVEQESRAAKKLARFGKNVKRARGVGLAVAAVGGLTAAYKYFKGTPPKTTYGTDTPIPKGVEPPLVGKRFTKGLSSGTGKADDDDATIKQSKKPAAKKPVVVVTTPGAKKAAKKVVKKAAPKKVSARVGDPKEAIRIHSAISAPRKPATVTAKENPMGRSIDNVLRGIFSFAGALPQASDIEAPKSRQRKDQEKRFKQFLVK